MFSFILLTSHTFAQGKSDIGGLIGGTYYLGDLNPSGIFKSPGYTVGVLYRYNFNKRYVLKTTANWLKLSASDANSTDQFQLLRNSSFSSNVIDISPQFEFNFLPLKFAENKKSFTPYISTGVGFAVFINSDFTSQVSLPLAIGGRMTFGNTMSIGAEWNVRKLFNDRVDGQFNLGSNSTSTIYHNNDWYYYAGIFVSFRLFANKIDCAVYE